MFVCSNKSTEKISSAIVDTQIAKKKTIRWHSLTDPPKNKKSRKPKSAIRPFKSPKEEKRSTLKTHKQYTVAPDCAKKYPQIRAEERNPRTHSEGYGQRKLGPSVCRSEAEFCCPRLREERRRKHAVLRHHFVRPAPAHSTTDY